MRFVPNVAGSVWSGTGGIWTLIGCPAGYALYSQQCTLCPGGCYCEGGSVPASACGANLYALPGARTSAECNTAVFVIVTISVPILRYSFSTADEIRFQQALANISSENPGYMIISGVNGDSETTVTSNIATADAGSAAALAQRLDWATVQIGLASHGFSDSLLKAVQVTACLPGFVLSESQVCRLCPAGFFCAGGSSGSVPCPAGYFAYPGANTSKSCKPAIFVVIVISLPVHISNITDSFIVRLETALADAAGISSASILILSTSQGRRASDLSTLVTAEIAASDSDAAMSISKLLKSSALESSLAAEGIYGASLQSVTTTVLTPVNLEDPTPIIAGSIVGLVVIIICIAALLISKAEPQEERELQLTISKLRAQLRITAQDGYLSRSFLYCNWSELCPFLLCFL